MSSVKKIGLLPVLGVVAGNMMGSGLHYYPPTLSSTVCHLGWVISSYWGNVAAYVYARLATKNLNRWPYRLCWGISGVCFQTGVLIITQTDW